MTDQHPLTDDKCYELWSGNLYENEKMRAAADWQLEQVLEWLKEKEYGQYHHDEIIYADDLRKAMRPTTTTTETP